MGRKKGRGGRPRHKPARFRRSAEEIEATNFCHERGAYLLVEGVGARRQWTVFRMSDGKEIGRYSPVTAEVRRLVGRPSLDSVTWVKLTAVGGNGVAWERAVRWLLGEK